MMATSITWPVPPRASRAYSAIIVAMVPARPGNPIGEAEGRQRRGSIRLAGDRREARQTLGDGAEAGPMGVRSELPESRHAHHHQLRIVRLQLLGTDIPAFERAGPKVLDQHIRTCRRARTECSAPPVFERSSVSMRLLRLIILAHNPTPFLRVAMTAHRVTAWVLDFDDVGAEIAQKRGHQRASEQRGQVQDAQSLKRRGHAPRIVCSPGR